jgi:CTP:molybdopterin cytidylyltransferase MocA
MDDLTPIILAAGASTRMGRPKALLDFDGKTALELALDAVAGHGTPVVVLGPNHEEIEAAVDLRRRSTRTALNLDVHSGQTASLVRGLSALPAQADAFFFMPVDFPLVSAADVARLVEAYRADRDASTSIFIPSHGMKRGHPVLCRRELAAEFRALPADASAREVIDRDPARIAYVLFPDAHVLMDMDTPEDYVRCLGAYRARNARES